MADTNRFYIHAQHPRAGAAAVQLAQATSGTIRPRLVRPPFGRIYTTYTGATRALERIRAAVGGIPQWDGYTLSVREYTAENVGTPAVVSRAPTV